MRTLFLFIITLNTYLSFCQQKGIVYYGYINALGIGNAKGTDSNAYMVFNREQSYYVTAKDSLEKSEKINEDKTYMNDDESAGSINLGMKVSKQGDQVVYHIKKHTMWSNILYGEQIYVKEVAPEQKWKIEKETKKIGKFSCKKATTSFRGRNYIAWFTTEIPLPFGPWKFNGLPGLILEAYDVNKFVYWYFKSVEYPTKNKENVKYMTIPKSSVSVSFNEFKKFQKIQLDKSLDKLKIVQKLYPQIIPVAPELSKMFIECE